MKISIIGCGYVGAVTGACLAELGNEICFIDIDPKKLEDIESHKSPIFEPGLDALLKKNSPRITTNRSIHQGIQGTDCSFICVGTPSNDDGSINLDYIRNAAEEIGQALKAMESHCIIVKSTVVPGTTDNVVIPVLEKESGKKAGKNFSVATNPEFLKEGDALNDFFNPDRIVMGTADEYGKKLLEELYRQFTCPKFSTTIKTAEMIKYASNAFLATKISFANEIGNICKETGIDAYEVFKGVGLDTRISPAFFRCGIGFGGSCFPKDVNALVAFSKSINIDTPLLMSVLSVNEKQPLHLIELLKRHISPIKGKKIGILGLSFKPDTDDIRDSRAIPLISQLLKEGARVIAYDPMAINQFRNLYPEIEYARSANGTMVTDAVMIVTEWDEFRDLDYTGKIVIDGRRVEKAMSEARIYEGVCW